MKSIAAAILLLSAVAVGHAAPPPAKLSKDALLTTMMGRLRTVGRCGTPKERLWCLAANGWDGAAAAELPAGDQVLLGVSVPLERDNPDDDLLSGEVSLSALAIGGSSTKSSDARKALITDIDPQNPAEKRDITKAIDGVAATLRGHTASVAIAPPLARYLKSLPADAAYPMTRAGVEWRFTGKAEARVRKVGNTWVVVEFPGDGPEGIFVSIYTDQISAAAP